MGWPTAQTVVTQAALELGLIQSTSDWGEDVYASSDSTVAQFLALLKKAGRDLVDEFDWTQLRQQYSFITGLGGQAWGAYLLPLDFKKMIDQTGWNRSTRLALGGPMSEQEWQYLLGQNTRLTLNILFRPMQGLLFLSPEQSPPSGQTIAMAYKSGWWVQEVASGGKLLTWTDGQTYDFGAIAYVENAPDGGPYVKNFYRCVYPGTANADPPGGLADAGGSSSPINGGVSGLTWNWLGCTITTSQGITPNFTWSDIPSSGADKLFFDEELLVAKLKLLWLKAKGFDSSDAETEYERTFMQASSNDSPAPVLSLNGRGVLRERLLGQLNVPITGFGG